MESKRKYEVTIKRYNDPNPGSARYYKYAVGMVVEKDGRFLVVEHVTLSKIPPSYCYLTRGSCRVVSSDEASALRAAHEKAERIRSAEREMALALNGYGDDGFLGRAKAALEAARKS